MSESAVVPAETQPALVAAPRPAADRKRRVLVTGASGMLGADVVPVLAGAGYQVFARPKADLDVTRPADVVRAFRARKKLQKYLNQLENEHEKSCLKR